MPKSYSEFEDLLLSLKAIDVYSDVEIPENVHLGDRVFNLKNICNNLQDKQFLTPKEYSLYSEIVSLINQEINRYTERILKKRDTPHKLRDEYPYYAGLKRAREIIKYYLWRLGPTVHDSKLRKYRLTLERKKRRIHKRLTKFMP